VSVDAPNVEDSVEVGMKRSGQDQNVVAGSAGDDGEEVLVAEAAKKRAKMAGLAN
jgi:hypothetical protein